MERLRESERETDTIDATRDEQEREHDDHRDDGSLSRDPARDEVVSRAAASADG
jgi:hypothetical protein